MNIWSPARQDLFKTLRKLGLYEHPSFEYSDILEQIQKAIEKDMYPSPSITMSPKQFKGLQDLLSPKK